MRRMNGRGAVCALPLLLALGTASPTVGQQSRSELVARGRSEFDPVRQRQLLRAALNLQLGPPDSAFAIGVQALAQNLLSDGQETVAQTWLKWAIRLWPEMRADTLEFPPNVIQAYRQAEDEVLGAVRTGPEAAWQWPAVDVGDTQGSIVLRSSDPATAQVLLQGFGLLTPGQAERFDPATYTIQATAPGRVARNITVEVLPGVVTQIDVSLGLLGEIDPNVELGALDRVVKITTYRLGQSSCATGFLAGGNGLVLTTYEAVRGAEEIEVETASGVRVTNVQVASHSTSGNVAVLSAPMQRTDSLFFGPALADGDYAWALNHPACGAAGSERTQIAGTPGPGGPLQFASDITGGEQGGPLIDNNGAAVGLTTGPSTAVPISSVAGFVNAGRTAVRASTLVSPRQVADRENHLYGRLDLTSNTSGARARVVPLESWHWAGAGTTRALPFVFAGPRGRYRVELLINNQVARQTEVTVASGQLIAQSLDERGGKFPVVAVVGGLAAAGAAVFLLAGGGGPGTCPEGQVGTPPNCTAPTGTITFTFPNPSIIFPNP